jgi:hypothetical protein
MSAFWRCGLDRIYRDATDHDRQDRAKRLTSSARGSEMEAWVPMTRRIETELDLLGCIRDAARAGRTRANNGRNCIGSFWRSARSSREFNAGDSLDLIGKDFVRPLNPPSVPTRLKNGLSHERPICLDSLWLGELFGECDLCRISTTCGRHLERLRSALFA